MFTEFIISVLVIIVLAFFVAWLVSAFGGGREKRPPIANRQSARCSAGYVSKPRPVDPSKLTEHEKAYGEYFDKRIKENPDFFWNE